MRARLARATPGILILHPRFTRVRGFARHTCRFVLLSSLRSLSSLARQLPLLAIQLCSIFLSLSRRTPAVPFASGGDIYTRINPAHTCTLYVHRGQSPGI